MFMILELCKIGGQLGRVSSVCIGKSGNWVATGGDDRIVKLWSLQSRSAQLVGFHEKLLT